MARKALLFSIVVVCFYTLPSVFSPSGFSTITPIHLRVGGGGGGASQSPLPPSSSRSRDRSDAALRAGGRSRMQCARRQCDIATMHAPVAPKKRTTNSRAHITVTAVDAMFENCRAGDPRAVDTNIAAVSPQQRVAPQTSKVPRFRRVFISFTDMLRASSFAASSEQSRESRARRRNYVRGMSELNSLLTTLERDAQVWVSKLPNAPAVSPTGSCVVCMDPLREGTACACGCGARCGVVKRLVCCGQDLHHKCLNDFVLRQLSGELFTDTMDEMLAWMTLGKEVVQPYAVLTELSLQRNFMCCPLCRSSFLVAPPQPVHTK